MEPIPVVREQFVEIEGSDKIILLLFFGRLTHTPYIWKRHKLVDLAKRILQKYEPTALAASQLKF